MDAALLLDTLGFNDIAAGSGDMKPGQNEADTEIQGHVNTPNIERDDATSIRTPEVNSGREFDITTKEIPNSYTPTIDTDVDTTQTPIDMPSTNTEASLETSTDNVQQLAELIASISNDDVPSSQTAHGIEPPILLVIP